MRGVRKTRWDVRYLPRQGESIIGGVQDLWRLRIFVDRAAPEDAPYVETFCRELDGNLYRWEIRAAYGTGTSLAL